MVKQCSNGTTTNIEERFSDNCKATVIDNLTGLIWTKNASLISTYESDWDTESTTDDGAVTWQRALDYITKLNTRAYFDYTDWRLPFLEELNSLVDYNQHDPVLPAEHPFSNIKNYYWTSSTYISSTDEIWVVNMYNGNMCLSPLSGFCYVWPVRKEG